jgi:hypothetical protein
MEEQGAPFIGAKNPRTIMVNFPIVWGFYAKCYATPKLGNCAM